MWIEEVKDKNRKKVYKYIDCYVDPRTKRRKKISITLPNKSRQTQKEAQYILNKKIEERLNTKIIKEPNLTFHNLIEEWLPHYKQQVKESTFFSTKNLLTTVKKEIPKDWVVSGITSTDLNTMLEKLLYENELSNRYISIIKSKLNLLFSYAVKKQYIVVNPTQEIAIEYKRESRTLEIKDKFLEDDEYERLINYTSVHNKRYAAFFQWLYLTGMRPGKALALEKDDIYKSDDGYQISISGTLLYRERSVKEMKKSNSTKTAAGMRVISIPEKAVKIYKKQLELNPNGSFLFQTSSGTPFHLSAINTYLRNHKEEMDIDKPLSSHIFRHTHISKLAELGTPLYVIQDRVGHENSQITEKIYTHVTKQARKNLKDDLNKL